MLTYVEGPFWQMVASETRVRQVPVGDQFRLSESDAQGSGLSSSNFTGCHVIERKKGAVTYLQRAEDIMDFFDCDWGHAGA